MPIIKCWMWGCRTPPYGQLQIGLLHIDSGRHTTRKVYFCEPHFFAVLTDPMKFHMTQHRNSPIKAVFISAEVIV